jgi:hypothetical protein
MERSEMSRLDWSVIVVICAIAAVFVWWSGCVIEDDPYHQDREQWWIDRADDWVDREEWLALHGMDKVQPTLAETIAAQTTERLTNGD